MSTNDSIHDETSAATAEAERRYPIDYHTVGSSAFARRAFLAGAAWQREQDAEEKS